MTDMLDTLRRRWSVSSRREFFTRAGSGLAGIALASMLAEDGRAAKVDLLAAKPPTVTPVRAKNIIWCFMEGAPSSIDTFDYKPLLEKLAWQPVPASFKPEGIRGSQGAKPSDGLMPALKPFKQRGQSGLWVSDWLPHMAEHIDEFAVIQSCYTDGNAHVTGVCEMNTGSVIAGRPSLGSWVTYGLGSAVRNLPTFIAMQDDKEIIGGVQNYSSGFLPATYQGTMLRQGDTPILNLRPPVGTTNGMERADIEFMQKMNELYERDKESDSELDARTRSYELAYQMQSAAPDAVDLSKESEATKKLYGMDEKETAVYGSNLLMARRLVERGVRFVECYSGSGSGWDGHTEIVANHDKWCKSADKPVAGLLADLKARGMLKDTLVVWGGEFGRTPFAQVNSVTGQHAKNPGRDHNPWGFTLCMAGGGVKGGQAIGTKDEIGLRAEEEPYHVWDVHASILYLLGIDHLKNTYMHNGRAERATVTGGKLITKLWA